MQNRQSIYTQRYFYSIARYAILIMFGLVVIFPLFWIFTSIR